MIMFKICSVLLLVQCFKIGVIEMLKLGKMHDSKYFCKDMERMKEALDTKKQIEDFRIKAGTCKNADGITLARIIYVFQDDDDLDKVVESDIALVFLTAKYPKGDKTEDKIPYKVACFEGVGSDNLTMTSVSGFADMKSAGTIGILHNIAKQCFGSSPIPPISAIPDISASSSSSSSDSADSNEQQVLPPTPRQQTYEIDTGEEGEHSHVNWES